MTLQTPLQPHILCLSTQKSPSQNLLLTILGQVGFTGDFIAPSLWHRLPTLL